MRSAPLMKSKHPQIAAKLGLSAICRLTFSESGGMGA
jgi:hypothetical protein